MKDRADELMSCYTQVRTLKSVQLTNWRFRLWQETKECNQQTREKRKEATKVKKMTKQKNGNYPQKI